MAMSKNYLPYCLGYFQEGDKECQGDPVSEQEADKIPCVFSRRCELLSQHIEATDKTVNDYCVQHLTKEGEYYATAVKSRGKFMRFLDVLVNASTTGPKKQNKPPPKSKKMGRPALDRRRKGPSRAAKKAAAKALAGRMRERLAKMSSMVEQFKIDFVAELDGKWRFVKPKQAPIPGMLYMIDHIASSRYISIYCKKPYSELSQGRDIPIVMLKFRTMALKFYIAFPLSAEEVKASIPKKVWQKMKPFKTTQGGQFKIVATGGLGTRGLSVLAEFLAEFVKSGQIALPVEEE